MFKKLKDKIAEEVKISPLKLQTSVQQFAQAMVTPSSSVSSIQESVSNDNFSIAEESEVSETPRNSPDKENSTFHRVDLREEFISPPKCPPVPRSRRSSASSMMSDVSSLFPLYESPSNPYHFQSDLESTSEIEEIGGSTSHLQGISKEQLLTAYRKTQTRYHKYKGRYVDLARHFRELERQNGKIKMVLTETQDRALRKIAELKEQCMLEQKAKAHLEDALRNDLEEKDHLINTLETKVKLLKEADASKADQQRQSEMHDLLIDLDVKKTSQAACQTRGPTEPSFQDKVSQLEVQLEQFQQRLNEQSEKFYHLSLEKATIDNALLSQTEENQRLKKELEAQRKREEEAALSLAENKMQVHRELEAREEEAKKLKALVAQLQEDLRNANRKKGIGSGGESIAVSSESIGSSIFEDSGAGGDSTSSIQSTSELTQLKEVLRGKYKEVEILVAENGRLRASLLMANSENGNFRRKLDSNDHFESVRQPELDINSSEYIAKGKKISMEESDSGVNFLHGQCSDGDDISQEMELKNSSEEETLSETNELNKKNTDLSVDEHMQSGACVKRLAENKLKAEIAKINREWAFKYNGIKEELDHLVFLKEEMKRLLSLKEIPSDFSDDHNNSAVMSDSLVHSLISVLRERCEWNKERKALTASYKNLSGEFDELKGILQKFEEERSQFGMIVEEGKNEVNHLNGEVESLRRRLNALEKEKGDLENEVVRLQLVSDDFSQLQNELESVQIQSKDDLEKMKEQWLSEVSNIAAALEDKEKQLQQVRAQFEHALSTNSTNKREEELLVICHSLEEEISKERDLRVTAEYSANALQSIFYDEYVSTLADGKLILREAFENVKTLQQEVDELKSQCECASLQEKETKKAIQELKDTYDNQLKDLQKDGKKALLEVECVIKERDDARRGEAEAQKKATNALFERDALKMKKEEAESRATKVENELKAVRELEERAKVEAEEAVHEQAAMRRSWEMQRDQIESMSREIEGLKKAEDGLIRVLKEVREEVKNKDIEIKRLMDDLMKEKKANFTNEEKTKNENCNLKKLIEEYTLKEEQNRKEMDNLKDFMNDWKEKSDTHEKELEVMSQEKKSLQKKLQMKEEEVLMHSNAAERLTKELATILKNEKATKSEVDALNNEMSSLKSALYKSESEALSLKNGYEELSGLKKTLEEKLEMAVNEMERLQVQKKMSEETIVKLRQEVGEYKCKMENCREELGKVKNYLNNLKERCKKEENEVTEKKEENVRLKERLKEAERELFEYRDKVTEISRNEQQLREELESLHSSVKESKLSGAEDVIERQKVKDLNCAPDEGNEILAQLKMDKDEALKNLEVANERIELLKSEISSLDSSTKLEHEDLRKKLCSLEEELNVRNEQFSIVTANNARMEEELKSVAKSKVEVERKFAKAQKLASEKEELEARLKELEKLVKKMEREFDATVADKEEKHQEQLSTYSERMKDEVDSVRRQLMEEINGLRDELIAKEDAYENLSQVHNQILNEKKSELDALRNSLSIEKEDVNKVIENETNKWKAKISELEEKHKEAIKDIQKAWETEKKELEVTSKVAVAAVESGTGSMSYLKRQIQAQVRELAETKRKYNSEILELRHLLSLGRRGTIDSEKSRLDDSTELEYLRNILYEYMMGKEPMILARVIAAVVKFDDEQTKKILSKEEQKQTLLGQFGLT